MALIVLLSMIAVPIVEIAVFIQVGGEIGVGPTIGIVILTAIAGTALLRHQGFATLQKAQANLDSGVFPLTEVFDGLCLLVAGALLLTPGFVTDAVGMILFVPAVRSRLRGVVGRHLIASGRVRASGDGTSPGGSGAGPGPKSGSGPGVIEGEYTDVTPPDETHRDR